MFGRMAREDSRVRSLLQAITLPVRRTKWRVDQNGASDEVTEFVARNFGLEIKGADEPTPIGRTRNRFSWDQHLHFAMLSLKYGHAYFEQVYRIVEWNGKQYAIIRKLAPRPAQSLSAINVAADGGLDSISQWSAGTVGVTGSTIPVNRLVAYVYDAEPGDWVGNSVLRSAYKHWLLKDELMRIQAATARRNGMGVPAYFAQQGATDSDLAKGQQMASEFRGGDKSGLAVPYGADFKLLGVQGNLPDIQAAIQYHDKAIALSGLAHFLNLDGGGSYALASVQENTFVQSVQTFADQLCDIANAHVVEDLVDINFGDDVQCPRIVFDPIGSQQNAVADALKTLVDAGILFPDRKLENDVRDRYGLPAKDPNTSTAQPVPANGGENA